ncbi:MAG: STAS domain-containing protein [Devosia nanyangense]|uniref:STAS domain-containing protein n=1 Tax=Devosia nanyangense TaxID=1228055 RepID=A0A933L089_9HYPH|nr:STAS domain-containing protein [Devosia nanyangense]
MAETADTKIVALPAIVDLDALDTVRDGLIDAVELGAVEIDGSRVERVATNALLMLVSAAETSRRNNFAFSISGASAPMLAAIDRLGLGGSFSALMKG